MQGKIRQTDEVRGGNFRRLLASFGMAGGLCSVLLAASFLSGCRDSSHAERRVEGEPARQPQQQKQERAKVQVFEDEALLKGSQAVVGGTVVNTTGETLEDLSVELELRSRKDQATEKRTLPLDPARLAPGEKGRYSLTLPSQLWSGSRLVRLRSAAQGEDIPYTSQVGVRRPPERIPESRTKIVNVPRPRSKGDDFINTPDNPERIP